MADFGDTIRLLRQGTKVARRGWAAGLVEEYQEEIPGENEEDEPTFETRTRTVDHEMAGKHIELSTDEEEKEAFVVGPREEDDEPVFYNLETEDILTPDWYAVSNV
jgi:hypothetical protein